MERSGRIWFLICTMLFFCGCISLATGMSVNTLPDDLTIIEENAFSGAALTNIELPSGLLEIRARAFVNSGLTEIYLPASLKKIADNAFDDPSQMEITADKGTYAYSWAVRNGYILPFTFTENADGTLTITGYDGNDTELVIPGTIHGKTVTGIGSSAFISSELQKVTLPESIIDIESYAFNSCPNLTQINIPSSARVIGPRAFNDCDNLVRLDLPDNISDIGTAAFPWEAVLFCGRNTITAKALTEYSFTCSGEEDYRYAWRDGKLQLYKYLGEATELVIPEWVQALGTGCCQSNTCLKKVTVPVGITEISSSAFSLCPALEQVVLPEGLEIIDIYAFYYCSSLTQIAIPASVSVIRSRAFFYCDALKRLELPDNITEQGDIPYPTKTLLVCGRNSNTAKSLPYGYWFAVRDDEDFACQWDNDELILYSYRGSATELQLPEWIDGLRARGSCFKYCNTLKRVDLNQNIKKIPITSFWGCASLQTLILPDSVIELENDIVYECDNLTALLLPASISIINEDALNSYNGAVYVYPNTFAYEWCIAHEYPYKLIDPMMLTVTMEAVDYLWVYRPVNIFAHAEYGVPMDKAPYYEYRYTVKQDGEVIYSTDWLDDASRSIEPSDDGNYSVRVEARDRRGVIISEECAPVTVYTPTQQEIEVERRKTFHKFMIQALNGAKRPEQAAGYSYYNSLPDEWPWIMDWMSFLSGDAVQGQQSVSGEAERKYYIANAIKMAATEKEVFILGEADVPKDLQTIASFNEADVAVQFTKWAKSIGEEHLEELNDLYDLYCKGNLADTKILNVKLEGMGFSATQIPKMTQKMEMFRVIHVIGNVAKGLRTASIAINNTVDAMKQISLLQSLDMDQLKIIAKNYKNTGSDAKKKAGDILMQFANKSEPERVLSILLGAGEQLGLDVISEFVTPGQFLGAPGKVFDAIITGMDLFTGVKSLPKQFHQLEYATNSVHVFWNQFTVKRSNYKVDASNENFTAAYYALINYYESVAQAEDAFIELESVGREAWLHEAFMGDLSNAVARSRTNAQSLRLMIQSMRQIYDVWKEGDFLEIMDDLDSLFRSYTGYSSN